MTRAQTFGAYELLDRISAGGMAEVYRARDSNRGHLVALKRILPHIAEDEEFTAMFEDEARIASQLEHPHIARTLDFGQVEDTFFIAFEYVHGKDMRALFERCRKIRQQPPLPFLLYVFTRIGEGLSYAHARRDATGEPVSIVHRDVSPQNLVVSTDGDVKLIDFGIAKAEGKISRTQAGTIKGKFGYMSPEQIRGDEVDARTDVFSMGICMWELLTLERLYEEPNELLVLKKIRDYDVPPPSRINSNVPPELDRIVLRALARESEQRYRSARDLYRDLNAFSESKQWVAKREEIAQYMRRMFPELGPSEEAPGVARLGVVPRVESVAPSPGMMPRQENQTMGANNKGSDLDIFEGLGKKAQQPSGSPVAPAERLNPRKTLMGLAAPTPSPSAPGAGQGKSPNMRPAAGRPSLPDIAPPPHRDRAHTASFTPGPAPVAQAHVLPGYTQPADLTRPPPHGGQAATQDLDWDDDEATQVMRESSKSAMWAVPAPESMPPPLPARATRPPPGLATTLPAGPAPAPPPGNNGSARPPPVTTTRPPTTAGNTRPPPGAGAPSNRAPQMAAAKSNRPPPAIALQAPPPPPPPPITASAFRPPGPPPPQNHGGILAPQANLMPFAGGPGYANANPAAQATVPSGSMSRPPTQPARAPVHMNRTLPLPTMHQQAAQRLVPGPPAPMRSAQMRAQQPAITVPPGGSPGVATRNLEATHLVRPSGGKSTLWAGLVLGILGLSVAVIVLFLVPRSGRLVITATDPRGAPTNRLEIFVDGKKQCDTSPCLVEGVSVGSHVVKLLATGFEPLEKTIGVESRRDTNVDFPLSTPGRGTGIRITGNQASVKLFIDGREIGPLPQEIRDLAPGDHKIRFVGSERYEPTERNITVGRDEIADLGAIALKVVKGKATITLATPGAKVYLVSGTDKRDLPSFPISVDIDTSKSWTIEASKPGFVDQKFPISFADGQAERVIKVDLEPRPTTVAAAHVPAPPPPAQPRRPRDRDITRDPPDTPPTTATTDTTPDSSNGGTLSGSGGSAATGESFLNINSLPSSSLVLDGKPIGNTPKTHVSVSPGSHNVTFVNAEQGLKKQVTVNVGAGETKTVIGKLRE